MSLRCNTKLACGVGWLAWVVACGGCSAHSTAPDDDQPPPDDSHVSDTGPDNAQSLDITPGDSDVPGNDAASQDTTVDCYYPTDTADDAAATLTLPAAVVSYTFEQLDDIDSIHVRLVLSREFVDNSYGATAVGWSQSDKGHTFEHLVRSDHAQLLFRDGNGQDAVDLCIDYLSEATGSPSGYDTLGVTDGDGALALGASDGVLQVRTSLAENLNARGYGGFVDSSPTTDVDYSPSPEAPNWDYHVIYEVWIAQTVFGAAGFGDVRVFNVHASPSKIGVSTVPVDTDECPETSADSEDPVSGHNPDDSPM